MISPKAARTLTNKNIILNFDRIQHFLDDVTTNIEGSAKAGLYHCEVTFEDWELNLCEIDYILSKFRSLGYQTECLDEYARFRISW